MSDPIAGPPLPSRTRLYALAPIGVGTAAVESLSGYVMRLAEAHCVPTGALVGDELLAAMRPAGLGGLPPASWLGRTAGRLNGPGAVAREAAAALMGLTGRPDLGALTLLPWSPVVAAYGLQRRRRAWCTACYAEALERDQTLYEPLLWAVNTVAVCARHRLRLRDRCPYDDCRRRSPMLAAHARPGHCSWCRRVLVPPGRTADEPAMEGAEARWSFWAADQLGGLLATGPMIAAAGPPARIGTTIAAFTAALGQGQGGTHGAFARAVGIHKNLVHTWRAERARPTLSMLLRMCHGLGVSLVDFVAGDTGAFGKRETRRWPDVLAPTAAARLPQLTVDTARPRHDIAALGITTTWPPLSGAAAARRLGCSAATLCRCCPDEWRRLVSRYRTYRTSQRELRVQELADDVRQAMLRLDAQRLYPSAKRILPLLRRRIHPRRAQFYVIRRQLLQDLGWA